MFDPREYLDDFDFDHDDGSPFGCEREGCAVDVIAGWWECEDLLLGVLGCEAGHLEVYEHHERMGPGLCWNCWKRSTPTEWGSAQGHLAEGGYCSRVCRDQDTPQRIARLAFKLFNASGAQQVEALCQIADEASLLRFPKAR